MSAYTEAVDRIVKPEGDPHELARQRSIDEAAARPEPTGLEAAVVARELERFKPAHLLTAEELDARLRDEGATRRLAERRRRLHDSGIVRVLPKPGADIPRIVHGALETKPALVVVRDWWRDGKPSMPWLWLAGPTGIGKTWAGGVVLADRPGRYVTASQLVRAYAAVREATGPLQRESADREWAALVTTGVLVLDEVGRPDDERDTNPLSRLRVALHLLVDERGARHTLVLTNTASARLRKAFEDGELDRRTASRLRDLALPAKGGRLCWEVVDNDMRGRNP